MPLAKSPQPGVQSLTSRRRTLVGSRISAAYLPHGRCRTPRYLTLPVASLPPAENALSALAGEAPFFTPSPDFLWLEPGFCSWLENEEALRSVHSGSGEDQGEARRPPFALNISWTSRVRPKQVRGRSAEGCEAGHNLAEMGLFFAL